MRIAIFTGNALRAALPYLVGAQLAFAPTSAFAVKGDCGQPSSNGPNIAVSDALFVLRVAVNIKTCDLCVCDVNSDNKINVADALKTLRKAVGLGVVLTCPACVPSLVGIVSIPEFVSPGIVASLSSRAVSPSGLVPAPGVTVELVGLDAEGVALVPVIATTTSGADGSYKFTPLPAASSQTIVRATIGAAKMRAFVTGASVDVDPMSEFVVGAAIGAVAADGNAGLDKLTVGEIHDLTLLMRQAGVNLAKTGSIADAVTMLDDQTSGVYGKAVSDFATGNGVTPALAGAFRIIDVGAYFARSFTPGSIAVASVNQRSVSASGVDSAIAVGGDSAIVSGAIGGRGHDLVEISGSTPQQSGPDVAINASATLSNHDLSPPAPVGATLRASNHGAMLLDANGTVAPGVLETGSNLGILAAVSAAPSISDGYGVIGFAVRQGQGLSNASLSATYSMLQVEIDLEANTAASNVHRATGARSVAGTMTFDGNGHLNLSAASGTGIAMSKDGPLPAQPAADPVVQLTNDNASEGAVNGLTYTLTASGELTVKSGSTVIAHGAVTPDANVVVLRFGDENAESASAGFLVATKRGTGMNTATGQGTYRTIDYTFQVQHNTQVGVPDVSPGNNYRQVSASATIGSFDLDGVGTVSVHGSASRGLYLSESSSVQTHSAGPDDVSDAFVSMGTFIQPENNVGETHTYSVASDGVVTVDVAKGGGQQGYLSPDGNLFMLPNSNFGSDTLEAGMLIAVRKP